MISRPGADRCQLGIPDQDNTKFLAVASIDICADKGMLWLALLVMNKTVHETGFCDCDTGHTLRHISLPNVLHCARIRRFITY